MSNASCPQCGHANREGAKFCDECGAPMQAKCSACGMDLRAGAKFCDECGQKVGATPTQGRSSQPVISASGSSPAATPSKDLSISGELSGGRYTVARFLGEGARKRVYLANDTRLGREVALGMIKTDGLDADGRLRVRREAQAMGRLGDHPHIVTVFDVEEDGDSLFMVSQYMAGGDLEGQLRDAPDHKLSTDEALRIGGELASALAHAHGREIIHRDLKPGNVWLDSSRTALLGDFGLAIALDQSRLTQEGMIVGTAAYLSPEQAVGGMVDARSDLYALGCMLYEMVAGKPPFLGDDAVSVISQHLNTTPIAPTWHNPAVPPSLEALIMSLLAKAPDDRPASAQVVQQALRNIDPSPEATDPSMQMPVLQGAGAFRAAWGQFVGRDKEMGQLKTGLDGALSGRGNLMMLVGEPGIGKTRTSDELATYAKMRGAQVLIGRCYEGEGAPAYWPWIQVIRDYVYTHDAEALRTDMGSGAADIARVVSDVRNVLPGVPAPPEMDAEAARFRLFDGVTQFLRNACRRAPLLLVLDDLHWADKSSLLLLQFLSRELQGMRLQVLGTYRDVELDRQHPLAQTLADLRRERLYERVLLRGFTVDEVVELLSAMSRQRADQGTVALAEAVHRETEGNPFFCEEVILHLVESGGLQRAADGQWVGKPIEELGIPEGVREVLGRRLSQVSAETNTMLGIAAVVGREFGVRTVTEASGLQPGAVAAALDEAEQHGLIGEPPGATLGRYRFTHALIRETLYEELRTPDRVKLHRAVGETIEKRNADNLDTVIAALAHHFSEGARAGGDVDKAVQYAQRAAERAMTLVAYDDAVMHFGRALSALELAPEPDPIRKADILIGAARAYWAVGDPERAHASALEAVGLARDLGDVERLGRAAVAYQEDTIEYGVARSENIDILEEAIAAQPDQATPLLANLYLHLLTWLFADVTKRRRYEEVAKRAVDIAEEVGDRGVLAYVDQHRAMGRLGILGRADEAAGDDDAVERLSKTIDYYEEAGKLREAGYARFQRSTQNLRLGNLDACLEDIADIRDLADHKLRDPRSRWSVLLWDTLMAIMHAEWERARELADQAFEVGSGIQAENAMQFYASHRIMLIYAMGDEEGFGELMLQSVAEYAKTVPSYTVFSASGHLGRYGDPVPATAVCDRFAEEGVDWLPRDIVYTATMSLAADLAFQLNHVGAAEVLYDALTVYSGTVAVAGINATCSGPIDAYLAMAALVLERWDDAARLIDSGERLNQRLGFVIYEPLFHYLRGELAHRRDGTAGRSEALAWADRSLTRARELGFNLRIESALDLKLRVQGVDPTDLSSSIHAVMTNVGKKATDFSGQAGKDGTVTLLFSDVVDFTKMTERLGDERSHEVMQEHNTIVRDALAIHGGKELELQGDGFLLAFADATNALRCAVAIQRRFVQHNSNASEQLHVRMGLHTGEAIRDADKFFGKTVILASRIVSQADGAQILVSADTKNACDATLDLGFDEGTAYSLKGLADEYTLHLVQWSNT